LGVPIADEKLVGPVHVLTFLGLEIDTDEMMTALLKKNQRTNKGLHFFNSATNAFILL
jgi:hypothetical protein